MNKKKDRMYCDQPDREFPKMKCGYPLPCPWHTIIIEKGAIKSPMKLDEKTSKRVSDIADALREL